MSGKPFVLEMPAGLEPHIERSDDEAGPWLTTAAYSAADGRIALTTVHRRSDHVTPPVGGIQATTIEDAMRVAVTKALDIYVRKQPDGKAPLQSQVDEFLDFAADQHAWRESRIVIDSNPMPCFLIDVGEAVGAVVEFSDCFLAASFDVRTPIEEIRIRRP